MLTKQVGMILPLKWPLRLACSAIIFFFVHKKTTMDVWASLAQVFKVQVITRLERNRKTGTNTARAPRPLSWLIPRARWWLTTALLDWTRSLRGAGGTWHSGRVDPSGAGSDYLWGTRRRAQPQRRAAETTRIQNSIMMTKNRDAIIHFWRSFLIP